MDDQRRDRFEANEFAIAAWWAWVELGMSYIGNSDNCLVYPIFDGTQESDALH